jgi:hypothetical protein
MGRGITYCESCGHRLLGEAFVFDGRTFCEACRPTSTVPLASKRPSSGRLPKVPARRPKETTRVRRKRGLHAPAIGVAAAAALAVGIALAVSASAPAPAAPPAASPPRQRDETNLVALSRVPEPAPSIEENLARVRAIRESDLMFERRGEVLKLLREASGRGEADRLLAEYERRFEDTAARLADFARSEALRLAEKRKFAEAIASLDGLPAAFRDSQAAKSLGSLRSDLERRRGEAAKPAAPSTPPGSSPILPLIAGAPRRS